MPRAELEAGTGFNIDQLTGDPVEPAPVTPVRITPDHGPVVDRRRLLWRDSATILVFVVLALLGAQLYLPRGTAGPSDSLLPSGIRVGSLPPSVTLAPGMTLGPVVDPSLGIDATPTPIPVITLGPPPTPKPTRTPRPSGTPGAS